MNFGAMGGGPKSPIKQDLNDGNRENILSSSQMYKDERNQAIEHLLAESPTQILPRSIDDVMNAVSASKFKIDNDGNRNYVGYHYSSYPEDGAKFLRKNYLFVKSFDAGEGVFFDIHNRHNYDDRTRFDDFSPFDEHFGMISTLDGQEMPIPVFFEIYGITSPFEKIERFNPFFNPENLSISGEDYNQMLKKMLGERCLGVDFNGSLRNEPSRLLTPTVLTAEEDQKIAKLEERYAENELTAFKLKVEQMSDYEKNVQDRLKFALSKINEIGSKFGCKVYLDYNALYTTDDEGHSNEDEFSKAYYFYCLLSENKALSNNLTYLYSYDYSAAESAEKILEDFTLRNSDTPIAFGADSYKNFYEEVASGRYSAPYPYLEDRIESVMKLVMDPNLADHINTKMNEFLLFKAEKQNAEEKRLGEIDTSFDEHERELKEGEAAAQKTLENLNSDK